MPAYYADIRGGRPIAPEHLADLVARYRALGVEEPQPAERDHRANARRARAKLAVPVFTGMKHWTPRIAEAAERALAGEDGSRERSLERDARAFHDLVQRMRLSTPSARSPVKRQARCSGAIGRPPRMSAS